MAWPEQIFKWLGYGKYQASPVAVADGATAPLLIDPYGRLQASVQGTIPAAYNRQLAAANAIVSAVPCSLIECWGRNDSGADRYLQFHNRTTVPSGGEAPLEVFKIDDGASFSFGPGSPVPFSTGLVWVVSTTKTTFTASLNALTLTVAYK